MAATVAARHEHQHGKYFGKQLSLFMQQQRTHAGVSTCLSRSRQCARKLPSTDSIPTCHHSDRLSQLYCSYHNCTAMRSGLQAHLQRPLQCGSVYHGCAKPLGGPLTSPTCPQHWAHSYCSHRAPRRTHASPPPPPLEWHPNRTRTAPSGGCISISPKAHLDRAPQREEVDGVCVEPLECPLTCLTRVGPALVVDDIVGAGFKHGSPPAYMQE